MSVDLNGHIDYLCIGHCCHDKVEDGYELGGTAAYSALIAKNLGAKAGIITAYSKDFLYEEEIENRGVNLINIGSDSTTVFENIYGKGSRQQVIHSRARVLDLDEINSHISKPDIVHLCPIANEVDYGIIHRLDCGFIGATIQGSIRCWDNTGKIFPCEMNWSQLEGIDVVIISDEDVIGMEHAIEQIRKIVPLLVITSGKTGARLVNNKVSLFMPAFSIEQNRETGAGDTFAAAFFMHFHANRSALDACIYAHAIASLVLERNVDDIFPDEEEIEKRISQYQKT